MNKNFKPINFSEVKTYPIKLRKNKVKVNDFAGCPAPGSSFREFLSRLPGILAAEDFGQVVSSIVKACRAGKPVILAMGAHVIKCGLNPVIIDLMKRGIIAGVAVNGAGIIHDFEIALIGETSEDVAEEIKTGRFGMVEETGRYINQAIIEAVGNRQGMGQAVGSKINTLAAPFRQYSILANAAELSIPVTAHVAIGTDIIHMHPLADGGAIGAASYRDFEIFCGLIAQLGDGGVYLNVGSAVILPEVFLKAVSVVRNLGFPLDNITTVNLDFQQQYRPLQNVVKRPVSGGKGYSLTGHHELMIPLLAQAVIEELG